MDKVLELKDVGLYMKKEAEKVNRDTITVDKKFWLEIADLLIETDNNLLKILKELEE